jgi:hypothetical protein
MSYDQQKDQLILQVAGSLASVATLAGLFYMPFHPIVVQEFSAMITTSPTVTPATIILKRRPTPGSDSGAITIGTLILPVGATIGNVYYKKGLDTKCYPGDEIAIGVTAAATAGAATFGFAWSPNWDIPANNSKMIASA